MEDLVIIDGNSLINRAFYALPLLSNSKGEFSNGVYGFANILIKAIVEHYPKYIAVALDYGKKTFRNNLFADYKGKRKPTPIELKAQFPLLKEMLKAMGIFYFEKEGFEADDIIGTLSKKFNTNNIIITGDRDALQLISNNTQVWLTKKGIAEVKQMTENSLMTEMNLKPSQIIELKSLMGDSSDNIPGVAGVGEKTALNLLNSYNCLDGVYENIENIKGALQTKLIENKQNAYLSKELATINTEVPIDVKLEDLTYSFPFDNKVFEFFKNYEFNSLIKREDLFCDTAKNEENNSKPFLANKIELITIDDVKKQIEHIKNSKKLAIEITENYLCFAYDKNCEFVCSKSQANLLDDNIDIATVLQCLKDVLIDEDIQKFSYDKQALKHMAKSFGFEVNNISFDCLLGYYLLIAGDKKVNKENLLNMYDLNNGYEAVSLIYLQALLIEDLRKNNLLDLYNNIEFPLVDVLYDMETQGFKVDKGTLYDLSNKYSQELNAIINNIIKLAGEDFNINSPKQLANILFNKLGLVCYNNKKNSTSIEHLEEIYDLHPIVPEIIRYRKLQKIVSTYIEPYKQIIENSQDNLIHTMFNQTLTTTGRLSSSEPNLQNIPIRDEEGKNLRKIFVTRYKDGALVCADYSQIELRLLAHMSKDETLINAFNTNIDIHTLTASEVFNVEIQNVTPTMRRTAKAVNFGIIYGISEYGLSQNINCSLKQARFYIEEYFKRYPTIKSFMQKNVEDAKVNGYSYTIFNRRRKINELFVPRTRMFGERIAMNSPLQGSASDIIKLAMINVYKALKENNLKSKLVLQIHDELIVDAPPEEITTVVKILKDNMENVVKLSVPLTVDINSGKTWFDC